MTKIRNKKTYSNDPEYLKRLAEELEFIGRPFEWDKREGVITQFAFPPKKRTKKKADKPERNKRAESAARRA